MKTSKNLLSIFCISACAGLMSCGGDETPSVSAENAKIAFNTVNQDLAQDIGSMLEAPGYTAMNSLSSLTSSSNPFAGGRISSFKRNEVRAQIKSSMYALRTTLLTVAANGRVSGDEPFNYNAKKGIYTWNSGTQTFDKTNSDIIKILYPTEGSATNNAEFQLTGYEEQLTPNGDDLYSPTFVRALILVGGVNQAKLELDVDYGTDDEPVLVDLYFFVSPYSIELNFDDTKATATSFSQNLSKESEVLIGVGLKVVYSASTKSEEDIQTVSGYLQLKSIRFIAVIRAGDVVNANDINDILDITIKIDGGNAGKVILELDSLTGEYVPYVKYNDGTTESLESLFEDLALELGGILS